MSLSRRILTSVAIDLDVGTAVFAVNHFITFSDRSAPAIAVVQQLAWAHGDDFAALRLFLGRIRQHDSTGRGFFSFHGFYNDSVI